MKIKDLEAGQKIKLDLLVSKVNKGVSSNGAPYLSVSLQDNTGDIEGKIWDVKPDQEEITKVGLIVEVNADVLTYRQNLQLRIHSVKTVEQSSYNLEDYLNTSKYDVNYLKTEIKGYMESIQDPIVKNLVEASMEFCGEQFYQYPAATRNHHDFVGGLAAHVYGMCKLAASMCEQYPIYNYDLLIAGCILHDMGKIEEYTTPVLSEYTTLGRLVGHISIMHANFTKIAEEQGLLDTEQAMLLRHIILSHHGQLDFGSPVVPMLKEAELLNFIDNIDARTNMFEKLYENQAEGEFSPRMFPLNNRNFYKAKNMK